VDYFGPDDAEGIPSDHWVVIEPNGGKCYGGKTLEEACAAALASPVAAEQGEPPQYLLRDLRQAFVTLRSAIGHGDNIAVAELAIGSIDAALAASPPLLPPSEPSDIERMIAECIPGGNLCDPQIVADAIRAYARQHAARKG